MEPRPGACPNIRGGVTIDRDLRADTKLWLTGWTKASEAATILAAASAIEPDGNTFQGALRWVVWLCAYSGHGAVRSHSFVERTLRNAAIFG